MTIAIGAEGVPVGDYTRTVLGGLPADQSQAILANVRSNEPDVAGIVGKLTQGAVDAGFVYRSDVEGAGGKLRAIELPAALKPTVEYGVADRQGRARIPRARRRSSTDCATARGPTRCKANGFGRPPGT